jgi:uncharacterized protein (DUF1501 family)
MCDHHAHEPKRADSLDAGHAHDDDHCTWSRRQFMQGLGLAAAGAAFSVSGTPMRALAGTSVLQQLRQNESDRVLVMIQLSGGNDGLNTIIPVTNDFYYNARPTIAIPGNEAIAMTSDFAMNAAMAPLESTFGNGDMAVVQGVGYPSHSLSHFQSTDVWVTGNELSALGDSGWSGRSLEHMYPDSQSDPLSYPLAMQIGGNSPLLFHGLDSQMGMSLLNVELFSQIAGTGKVFDEVNVPAGPVGNELAFVRSIANDSYLYASAIQDAAAIGTNDVEYPDTTLGRNLAVISQMIKGQLGTRIYHVNLSGFDTHSNQIGRHTGLFDNLSRSVSAFLQDLEVTGHQDDALVMTFSEFGRRINQNGSAGTDHGTAAPLFLFGSGVNGGMYGEHPDLGDVDKSGNMKFTTDFRRVYASVLNDWFGITDENVATVLGSEFDIIPFVSNPSTVATDTPSIPSGFSLSQNYPNPFNPTTRIGFTLDQPGQTRLEVFDIAGRKISSIVNAPLGIGHHEVEFNASGLASGAYLYRLQTPAGSITKRMTLLR